MNDLFLGRKQNEKTMSQRQTVWHLSAYIFRIRPYANSYAKFVFIYIIYNMGVYGNQLWSVGEMLCLKLQVFKSS